MKRNRQPEKNGTNSIEDSSINFDIDKFLDADDLSLENFMKPNKQKSNHF